MRVVADANVLVSAALGRSPEAPSVRVIEALLDSRIDVVMSPRLVAEVVDVLSRPRIRQRVPEDEAQRFLSDLVAQVVIVADPADPPQVCRDPDDDYLIALARKAGAGILVTGDADLLSIKASDAGVEVLTPRELVDRIN